LVHNTCRVALDNNALIAAVEGGVDVAKGRSVSVPVTAVKEFLAGGGDKAALRSFLQANGGEVLYGSQKTAARLQKQAAAQGRVIRAADAQVAAGAVDAGLPLVTRDKKLLKNLNAVGENAEGF
jgi:predicted nucleic acid-binding protein